MGADLELTALRFVIRPSGASYTNRSATIPILLKRLHDLLEVTLTRGRVDGGGLQPLMAEERGLKCSPLSRQDLARNTLRPGEMGGLFW